MKPESYEVDIEKLNRYVQQIFDKKGDKPFMTVNQWKNEILEIINEEAIGISHISISSLRSGFEQLNKEGLLKKNTIKKEFPAYGGESEKSEIIG